MYCMVATKHVWSSCMFYCWQQYAYMKLTENCIGEEFENSRGHPWYNGCSAACRTTWEWMTNKNWFCPARFFYQHRPPIAAKHFSLIFFLIFPGGVGEWSSWVAAVCGSHDVCSAHRWNLVSVWSKTDVGAHSAGHAGEERCVILRSFFKAA